MHFPAKYRSQVLVAISALSVAGCAPEAARLRQSFPHPGPVAYQRAEAIQHDPYPLDDVGPEIVGGRPREYQRPLNEVERARLAAPNPPGSQPVPAIMAPVGPAPVAAGPPYPVAPAPTAAPYPVAPAPIGPAPQTAPFQYQQRPPY